MKEFKGKVAVITGAAGGIGRAIAERCAQEGMRVVLADIEPAALDQAARELTAAGATVLTVRTDVSEAEEVERLAQQTISAFGAVDMLFNNAGVATLTTVRQSTQRDWEWVFGVNVWGVIHGCRTFIPLMLPQDSEGCIVNTASMAGLITCGPTWGIYAATKHAVVAISETLSAELAEIGAKIKVSVLCPGWVQTRILDSARNRPAALQNKTDSPPPSLENLQSVETGMTPEQVASCVFDAIRTDKFYILTHPDWKPLIQQRMENILAERNPASA